jgi:hypothetical protein
VTKNIGQLPDKFVFRMFPSVFGTFPLPLNTQMPSTKTPKSNVKEGVLVYMLLSRMVSPSDIVVLECIECTLSSIVVQRCKDKAQLDDARS